MTTDQEGAARRLMDQFGEESRIPVLNIDEGDVGVLLAVPLVGLFVAGLSGYEAFALPLVTAGLGIGVAIVYVTPAHLNAWEWVRAGSRFLLRPRITYNVSVDEDGNTDGDHIRNEGGLANRMPLKPDERTQDITNVRRAWPEVGAIERTDGTMEAFLELSPGNMDFAMSGDWAQLQQVGEEFANNELDWPLTFHATTRAFPVEGLVDQIEARLSDPDVTVNPTFRELLEEYRAQRPAEMRAQGIQEIRYFIGVEIDELAVYDRYRTERTPAEKLTAFPILGFLFNPFVTRRESLSHGERRERMFEKLDERLESVQQGFIQSASGWSARRLTTAELFTLNMTFWNGQGCESDSIESLIETDPSVDRRDEEARDAMQSTTEPTDGEDVVVERHQTAMAPSQIEWETRAARVADQWTRTLSIVEYPDYPSDGYLSDLFTLTDVEFDLTVDLVPKNQQRARTELQEIADDLQVDADLERSVRSEYLQERAREAAATYKAVESGQRVFDQAMFITIRADTRKDLREAVHSVQSTLRDDPANLTPKTAICAQDLALQSAAPIGSNQCGMETIALGGAVGALFASAHTATILEAGGVEFGMHKDNRSPVVIDPFARENGYAMFTVGDTGSGKSFSAKQNFIRSIEQSENRIGIILEPLNNWAGVADALGARRVTVGGTLGLNPLELKPTPEHVQRAMGDDASPFNEKLDDAMSFLTNFFALRGVSLGDRRTTLEVGLVESYALRGITDDIATHHNESPTMRDVMDVFEKMVADPKRFVVRTAEEAEKLRQDAMWLLDQLRPFEVDGRYANLGKETEFDIRDEKVIYLDLAQQEGRVNTSTTLTMQLLISLVYERAKETEKEVVFVIDEARYIMQDAASLSFLETVFRHHRHHDLSIRLVTQTVDEFFEHPESEAILDQCAVKQFHRLDGMDEHWAEEFGLNYAQMRFVQEAVPGNEDAGYSQALVGVDGEWRGIEVSAMDLEKEVIDYDPRELAGVRRSEGEDTLSVE